MIPTALRTALLTLGTTFTLIACSTAQEPAPPTPAVEEDPFIHQPFDEILHEHVRDERVDYLAIRDLEMAKLVDYLDAMAEIDPARLEADDRLAFYINVYNATMIRTVSERFVDGWNPSLNEFGVFEESLVHLRGSQVTLNHLENDIIRPTFKDARIHAALVCAARSCPPILDHAYRGEDLQETLESKMQAFVRDSSRNKLDQKKLGLSKLFEWYASDFGDNQRAVLGYVSRFAGKDLTRREFGTIDYSWTLNQAVPHGEWVVVKGDQTLIFDDGQRIQLTDGMVVEVILRENDNVRVREPRGEGEGSLPAKALKPFEVAG
ncbi:MAG: DUF547 domain-containing protein [Planctomycetota bacterium]